MLIALWPLLFPRNNAHGGGKYVDPDITHRAIRGKEQAQRTAAMLAAEAHLKQLREAEDVSHNDAGSTDGTLDLGIIPDSHIPFGNAPVRIPRHERILAGRLPSALGASVTASDALQYATLDEAMKRFAAKQQADEDDEMAMIAIMMAGLQ